jgi:hypothetical protein
MEYDELYDESPYTSKEVPRRGGIMNTIRATFLICATILASVFAMLFYSYQQDQFVINSNGAFVSIFDRKSKTINICDKGNCNLLRPHFETPPLAAQGFGPQGQIIPQMARGNPQMGGPQMAAGNPQMMGRPPMSNPQMGNPQMGNPQMGNPQMMGQLPMGNPQMMGRPQMAGGNPQMMGPQMGHPQMMGPQMGHPQMMGPQMMGPQMIAGAPGAAQPQMTGGAQAPAAAAPADEATEDEAPAEGAEEKPAADEPEEEAAPV